MYPRFSLLVNMSIFIMLTYHIWVLTCSLSAWSNVMTPVKSQLVLTRNSTNNSILKLFFLGRMVKNDYLEECIENDEFPFYEVHLVDKFRTNLGFTVPSVSSDCRLCFLLTDCFCWLNVTKPWHSSMFLADLWSTRSPTSLVNCTDFKTFYWVCQIPEDPKLLDYLICKFYSEPL